MTLWHYVDGERLQMTPEEEAFRLAEEAAEIIRRPTHVWIDNMNTSDSLMTREVEDILDRDGVEGLPQALVDKYNAKKTVRAAKPASYPYGR